jgi:hypothetical protein
MRKRTPWTVGEKRSFIEWHETAIVQYPEEIIRELRQARHKMLGVVRIVNENSLSQRSTP